MKKVVVSLIFWSLSVGAMAAGGGLPTMEANINLSNKVSLQRGARLFVNYCLSCHSANYMRYNRMAEDLELSEDAVKENLMFAADKVGDTMGVAIDPTDAETWFGVTPPDLSVIARAKGADWLYSFLNSYYRDDSRPTGVNNLYFTDTAMPHVLWELQGLAELDTTEAHDDDHGHGATLTVAEGGKLTQTEYQNATRDLVAFLVYMGEPAKLVRYKIGFWVIVFLFVLLVATYLMKREYWKDVH